MRCILQLYGNVPNESQAINSGLPAKMGPKCWGMDQDHMVWILVEETLETGEGIIR